ncbi:MAG: FmdB family zinc ribbon protein [Solirubrobacteraceae bacterium]
MPIYEYRRPDGSTFEVQQSFSEEPLTHDPDTGVAVQRVLHAPAVHFKGSGFYNTDYGTRKRQREESDKAKDSSSTKGKDSKDSSSSKDSSGGDSSTTSQKSAKDSSSTESKSAKKTESTAK